MDYDENLMNRMRNKRSVPEAIGRFGTILATGKPPATSEDDDVLKRMIMYNQLQTGTPEFKMQEAQTRSNLDMQKALDIEDAKNQREGMRYDKALQGRNGGGTPTQPITQPTTMAPMPASGPMIPSSNPFPQQGKVPAFIPISEPDKYDPKVGRFVQGDVKMQSNPDYLSPDKQAKLDEDMQANQDRSQAIRDNATQNLASIKEAEKGKRFFGPMGGLPSIAAPSTYSPFHIDQKGKPQLGGEYGDRKMWESNVNQLLSQKVVELITKMKQASKTGATGFGQLSDKEGAILREASTALNKGLEPEQAMYYLNEMEKINQRILNGGQPDQTDFSSMSDDELHRIASGG